jgi:predicted nucleic-acid-binding Zn-ribbon protein
MDNNIKCFSCGGTNIHKGTLHSTGKIHFRPSDAKFLKLKTADIEVYANMCLDCGSINLMGDIEKAKKVTDSE